MSMIQVLIEYDGGVVSVSVGGVYCWWPKCNGIYYVANRVGGLDDEWGKLNKTNNNSH